ncbi:MULTISPECIES: hypothetical protein [Nocardia]|uniref:hypothetical protein n=1 Tax=Nocardia TaxID=1817 RepID=UPI0024545B7F|nr:MULTISPECIES: hypothetical protein [Nocardia]
MTDSLFPDLEPVTIPDRFEGMGHDARRTARQADLIAAGANPATRLPLHRGAATDRSGPGLRCRDCTHLYRTGAGNKDFLKCRQAGTYNSRGSWGPDVRAWWPACRLFESKDQPE